MLLRWRAGSRFRSNPEAQARSRGREAPPRESRTLQQGARHERHGHHLIGVEQKKMLEIYRYQTWALLEIKSRGKQRPWHGERRGRYSTQAQDLRCCYWARPTFLLPWPCWLYFFRRSRTSSKRKPSGLTMRNCVWPRPTCSCHQKHAET